MNVIFDDSILPDVHGKYHAEIEIYVRGHSEMSVRLSDTAANKLIHFNFTDVVFFCGMTQWSHLKLGLGTQDELLKLFPHLSLFPERFAMFRFYHPHGSIDIVASSSYSMKIADYFG